MSNWSKLARLLMPQLKELDSLRAALNAAPSERCPAGCTCKGTYVLDTEGVRHGA